MHNLLPPAKEVWGKVIFSEACVKNSVHRGGREWLWEGVHGCRGGAWLQGVYMVVGACVVAGGGACVVGGGVYGCWGRDA